MHLRAPFLAAIVLLGVSPRSFSQWQSGNLAIITNGNMFQSGDQLKVGILALETINEPFSAQVSYQFEETVIEKDKDGGESLKQVPRTLTRKMSAVLESLDQFKQVVLDDTFHFGEGNPAGMYLIEIAIFRSGEKQRAATLRSCAFYQERDKWLDSCPLYLSSLKRANDERWLTFDGRFSDRARYTATLLSKNQIVTHIDVGVYPNGNRQLDISSDLLAGTTGRTFDILIHDHLNNYSTTLGRVTIPSAR